MTGGLYACGSGKVKPPGHSFSSDGLHAAVTGGAGGLGREVAGALVETGAEVAVFDRDAAALDALRPEILRFDVDVTDPESVERASERASEPWRACRVSTSSSTPQASAAGARR